VLDEVKETIINVYRLKTGKSRAKISQMMDEKTWMNAKKAVTEGFTDGILYYESEGEPVQNSFIFSRLSVQNSVNSSTRKFIEQYNKRFKELKQDEKSLKIKLLKAKLALECEL